MSTTRTNRTVQAQGPVVGGVQRGGPLASIQRSRLIEAAVAVAADVGVRNLTVSDIVSRACVSRRTFYETFDDCEDCVSAAFEDGAARAMHSLAGADGAPNGRWQDRVRSGLLALLRFFDEQPAMARFLVVESLSAGTKTLRRRQQIVARLVDVLDQARALDTRARDAPALAAEGAVGAVAAIVQARLLEPRHEPLAESLNPLTSLLVMPFLGTAAARRELERPMPTAALDESGQPGRPLGKLGMRLTYRTVRVLAAVAVNPGSSNRVIGESAGISDQGQISKLLQRLRRLGLVHNVLKERLQGEPNSWTLTEKGWQVHAAIRTGRDAA